MAATLIRWRLNEVMARHRVLAKDLAEYLKISPTAVSGLRKAEVMPRIDGYRLEGLTRGINDLSTLEEQITPYDLIEWIPDKD